MENVSPPALKQTKGANVQRQHTGRGFLDRGLGSACCEPHLDVHGCERKPNICTVDCREGSSMGGRDHVAMEAWGTNSGSCVCPDFTSRCHMVCDWSADFPKLTIIYLKLWKERAGHGSFVALCGTSWWRTIWRCVRITMVIKSDKQSEWTLFRICVLFIRALSRLILICLGKTCLAWNGLCLSDDIRM